MARKSGFIYWLKDKIPYFVVIIMVFIILFLFFFSRIFVVVKSGEAGVLYRLFTGTETNYIYPERFYLIWPWDTMYIYNARVQTQLHELTVLTKEGLPINLLLAIRFRPEYDMIGLLHKNIGPDYVDTIIIPQIESALRKNIGRLNPEDVYTNKEGILNKILRVAIDEASRKYVVVDDIIIRAVELPDLVKQAIEEKLVEEQTLQRYEYKIMIEKEEAERKYIEAQGIQRYQEKIGETLSDALIKWQAVHATQELAESENAKIIIIGAGEQGLPVILGNQWDNAPTEKKSSSSSTKTASPAEIQQP